MSSSDTPQRPCRRSVILAALALGACGFEPAYAPGGAALALRDSIAIEADNTPFDYRLRTALEDRLGQPATATYTLTVDTIVTEVAAAVAPDGSITRFNLPGIAIWALRDAATGAELATGQADSFTSYQTTGTTVATRAAEEDARDRLATALADLIVARLIVVAQDL